MQSDFMEDLKNIISSNLPTASNIVSEVIKTIYDRSSSALDIAEILEKDPPLSAKILKVANSAYFAPTSEINSLQRAVVILGFDTIKEVVTTTSVAHYFFDSDSDDEIDRSGLWIHSVGTAKTAQLISEKMGFEQSDTMYTIGLLHDIGKLLLVLCFPEKYCKIIQLAKKEKSHVILAERKVLNLDHAMIGKVLCDLWKLPESLTEVIFYHHDPSFASPENQKLTQVIALADHICRKAGIGNPGDETIPKLSAETKALLGPSSRKASDFFESIFQKILDQKPEIETFFSSLK